VFAGTVAAGRCSLPALVVWLPRPGTELDDAVLRGGPERRTRLRCGCTADVCRIPATPPTAARSGRRREAAGMA